MLFGDKLIISQNGIHISNNTLATVGIFPKATVYLLPFRTFEYRETEPGYYFPMDLLITPIPPKQWPFVMRFLIRLRNQPGTLENALTFFRKNHINILFSECSRSGHHHTALNVLVEAKELEAKNLKDIYLELKKWFESRSGCASQNTIDSENDQNSSEPVWWSAFNEFYSFLKTLNEEKIHETEKKVQEDLDNITRELERTNGKKEHPDLIKNQAQLIGRSLAILVFKRKNACTIQDLLEYSISEAKPKVRKIRELQAEKATSSQRVYFEVEKTMVITKLLLTIILSYKRMLCEKYKVNLLEDALKAYPLAELEDTIPSNQYLYNIEYYKYVVNYPSYCGSDISNSTFLLKSLWENKKHLDNLPQERRGSWDWEPRLDLDPIMVTSAESLCHASYHRAYDNDFESIAQDSIIPFPEHHYHPNSFLINILSPDKPATVAIASRNTDELTLRLCLIPVTSLRRFLQIDMDFYRTCFDQCKYTNQNKSEKDKNVGEKDPENNKNDVKKNQENKGKECNGTSLGLFSAWTQAIYDQPCDSSGTKGTLNIWNVLNKTYQLSDEFESGSIHILAQATDRVFDAFPPDIEGQLKERLKQHINNQDIEISPHIDIKKISTMNLSGGRVFVSLPFSHPMKDEWLECVKRIGHEVGFSQVDTVETYTEPVTELIADNIKNSHAMIQILALPIKKCGRPILSDESDYEQKLIWLHAEYLTAKTNGLKVVRIIDENSIDEGELRIGRDHPNFKFSVMKPNSDFERCVRLAFEHLRRELAAILGLG
jgi:hypothetical protein